MLMTFIAESEQFSAILRIPSKIFGLDVRAVDSLIASASDAVRDVGASWRRSQIPGRRGLYLRLFRVRKSHLDYPARVSQRLHCNYKTQPTLYRSRGIIYSEEEVCDNDYPFAIDRQESVNWQQC